MCAVIQDSITLLEHLPLNQIRNKGAAAVLEPQYRGNLYVLGRL